MEITTIGLDLAKSVYQVGTHINVTPALIAA